MSGTKTVSNAAVVAELKELRRDLSAQLDKARGELVSDIDSLRGELRGDMKRLEDRLHGLESRTPSPKVIDDIETRLRAVETAKLAIADIIELKKELGDVKKEAAEEKEKRRAIQNKLSWYAGAIVGISTVLATLISLFK